MKKFIIFIVIAISSFLQAQSQIKESTITTYHKEYYPMKVLEYRSKIDLTIANNGYGAPCYSSVEEMENAFYKKIKELGLNLKNIKKDEMEFLRTGYNRTGMTYVFTTKNKEDIKTFMKLKMPNGHLTGIEYKLEEPISNLSEHTKKALEKTREQAEAIAKSLNKKILGPKDISASKSRYKGTWTSYKEEGYLSLNVTYNIE